MDESPYRMPEEFEALCSPENPRAAGGAGVDAIDRPLAESEERSEHAGASPVVRPPSATDVAAVDAVETCQWVEVPRAASPPVSTSAPPPQAALRLESPVPTPQTMHTVRVATRLAEGRGRVVNLQVDIPFAWLLTEENMPPEQTGMNLLAADRLPAVLLHAWRRVCRTPAAVDEYPQAWRAAPLYYNTRHQVFVLDYPIRLGETGEIPQLYLLGVWEEEDDCARTLADIPLLAVRDASSSVESRPVSAATSMLSPPPPAEPIPQQQQQPVVEDVPATRSPTRTPPLPTPSVDWGHLFTEFYRLHNPAKLGNVATLLHKYQGEEEDLWMMLLEKYGLTPETWDAVSPAVADAPAPQQRQASPPAPPAAMHSRVTHSPASSVGPSTGVGDGTSPKRHAMLAGGMHLVDSSAAQPADAEPTRTVAPDAAESMPHDAAPAPEHPVCDQRGLLDESGDSCATAETAEGVPDVPWEAGCAASATGVLGDVNVNVSNGRAEREREVVQGPRTPVDALCITSPPRVAAAQVSPHRNIRTPAREDAVEPPQQGHVDWHARLTALYSEHNPQKLDKIPQILAQFRGKEDELWRALQAKYIEAAEDVGSSPQQPQQPAAMERPAMPVPDAVPAAVHVDANADPDESDIDRQIAELQRMKLLMRERKEREQPQPQPRVARLQPNPTHRTPAPQAPQPARRDRPAGLRSTTPGRTTGRREVPTAAAVAAATARLPPETSTPVTRAPTAEMVLSPTDQAMMRERERMASKIHEERRQIQRQLQQQNHAKIVQPRWVQGAAPSNEAKERRERRIKVEGAPSGKMPNWGAVKPRTDAAAPPVERRKPQVTPLEEEQQLQEELRAARAARECGRRSCGGLRSPVRNASVGRSSTGYLSRSPQPSASAERKEPNAMETTPHTHIERDEPAALSPAATTPQEGATGSPPDLSRANESHRSPPRTYAADSVPHEEAAARPSHAPAPVRKHAQPASTQRRATGSRSVSPSNPHLRPRSTSRNRAPPPPPATSTPKRTGFSSKMRTAQVSAANRSRSGGAGGRRRSPNPTPSPSKSHVTSVSAEAPFSGSFYDPSRQDRPDLGDMHPQRATTARLETMEEFEMRVRTKAYQKQVELERAEHMRLAEEKAQRILERKNNDARVRHHRLEMMLQREEELALKREHIRLMREQRVRQQDERRRSRSHDAPMQRMCYVPAHEVPSHVEGDASGLSQDWSCADDTVVRQLQVSEHVSEPQPAHVPEQPVANGLPRYEEHAVYGEL